MLREERESYRKEIEGGRKAKLPCKREERDSRPVTTRQGPAGINGGTRRGCSKREVAREMGKSLNFSGIYHFYFYFIFLGRKTQFCASLFWGKAHNTLVKTWVFTPKKKSLINECPNFVLFCFFFVFLVYELTGRYKYANSNL